jgi:hypothetical protein
LAERKAQQLEPNPDGDWVLYGQWIDRVAYCAEKLASFQRPKLKAILVPPASESNENERVRIIRLTVFEGGKALSEPGKE